MWFPNFRFEQRVTLNLNKKSKKRLRYLSSPLMGTCWSPTPISEASVHGPTMNPPAVPNSLLSSSLRVLSYMLELPAGQASACSSHRPPLYMSTSVLLRPVQSPVLGLASHEDRPETRTIHPGTDVDAYIPGKGAESLLQALNWLENLLKRHWSESPSYSGHRETGGSKQAKVSSPGSSARACLCPSDGCTGFRSQRLCSSCAGEEGSQTVVKSFQNNFSPQLPTFPN